MTGAGPAITSRRATALPQANAAEILDSQSDFSSLSTVAPGQNSGGAPFRQPCPAYPSASGERRRRYVSARKLPDLTTCSGNVFLESPTANQRAKPHAKIRSIQQAWMNSRNFTNIAGVFTHRQLAISHHRQRGGLSVWLTGCGTGLHKIADRAGTKTRSLARERLGFRPRARTPAKRLNLLIPLSASTLQVFQAYF